MFVLEWTAINMRLFSAHPFPDGSLCNSCHCQKCYKRFQVLQAGVVSQFLPVGHQSHYFQSLYVPAQTAVEHCFVQPVSLGTGGSPRQIFELILQLPSGLLAA